MSLLYQLSMPSYERYLPFHLYIPFLSPLRELYVMLQLFIVKLLIRTFQLIILFAEFSFLLPLLVKIKHSTAISYQETLDIYWVPSAKHGMIWSDLLPQVVVKNECVGLSYLKNLDHISGTWWELAGPVMCSYCGGCHRRNGRQGGWKISAPHK